MTHVHSMQPYGWVRMENCHVEERMVEQYDWNCHPRKIIMVPARFVVGTVVESNYCGALLCGVRVGKPDNTRYPIGSTHACRIRSENDLKEGRTIDVAS